MGVIWAVWRPVRPLMWVFISVGRMWLRGISGRRRGSVVGGMCGLGFGRNIFRGGGRGGRGMGVVMGFLEWWGWGGWSDEYGVFKLFVR